MMGMKFGNKRSAARSEGVVAHLFLNGKEDNWLRPAMLAYPPQRGESLIVDGTSYTVLGTTQRAAPLTADGEHAEPLLTVRLGGWVPGAEGAQQVWVRVGWVNGECWEEEGGRPEFVGQDLCLAARPEIGDLIRLRDLGPAEGIYGEVAEVVLLPGSDSLFPMIMVDVTLVALGGADEEPEGEREPKADEEPKAEAESAGS